MLLFNDLPHRLPLLRFWVSSGEPLSTELFERFKEMMGHATLYNLYGTSEVWDATWFDPIQEGQPYCGQIGRPIWNMRAYILLANGEPAPIGVPGELCIGGVGVARGYLGDAAVTDRFVSDPYVAGQMYRTGDFSRFLPDGNIQFLGRRDHQVKVRGHRIELTHVESILDQCPGVGKSVVVVRNGDGATTRVVAYVAPAPGAVLDAQRLRGYVRERLPAPMRPSGFVLIDCVPLTVSGKLDRVNLPDIHVAEELTGTDTRPPRTDSEQKLATLFRDMLGIQQVGIDDNFFTELGGNSLLATQLVSRVRDTFSTELPLRQFFEMPTIEQLAADIEQRRASGVKVTPPISRQPRTLG